MESLPNGTENEGSSPLQKVVIGGATLIVVILTVIAAVILAMQDQPAPTPDTPTVMAQVSPTATHTSIPVTLTDTPTTVFIATDTATPTPSPTSPEPVQVTPTNTTAPPPPTVTPVLPEQPTQTPVLPPPTSGADTTPGVCQPPADWVTYRVEVGDTLDSLARRTNVSVFDLQQVNCLEPATIIPGQVIYLPFTPPTPTPTNTVTPTGTRRPTPTRTSTPFAPRIFEVLVRLNEDTVVVFVQGENFQSRSQGFRAQLVGPTTLPLQLGAARTSTNFEATAPADQFDELAEYDLVVINPDGLFDTRTKVWPPQDSTPTPTPGPPEITRVSPSSGQIDTDVRLTVQGRNFRPLEAGFRVELRLDDGSLTVEVSVDETIRPATATSFDAVIFSGTLVRGVYDLLVTNPDGQTDIERFAYDALE